MNRFSSGEGQIPASDIFSYEDYYMQTGEEIIVGEGLLSCEKIQLVAQGLAHVAVSKKKTFRARMLRSKKYLHRALKKGDAVYGVNTGFGKSCGKRLPKSAVVHKTSNPLPFHGCGTGEPIGLEETRAAMLCRMICLATGYSGISVALLQQLADMLNQGVTPVVPSEGSVGASGDLTPMSYVAACMAGEREAIYAGRRMSARRALKKAGIAPYVFDSKEPLSMINGTSTMTGIAVISVMRARSILHAALCATALTVHAFKGRACHYHPSISRAKPFRGQAYVARCLEHLLAVNGDVRTLEDDGDHALQDPYSVRCTPQIVGVLYDALAWIERWIEIEVNSSNDNPIFDLVTGEPLMSGNFYGGHVAFAMDALKVALASVADMADRQIMLLVHPQFNRGLPEDLVGVGEDEQFYHHGFKAMSISASAIAAETLKNTMPASSFSRSTESHNQDKVSMGTIAARDARRACELVERVLAIHLLAAVQACQLRGKLHLRPRLQALVKSIRRVSPHLVQDRPLDKDIEAMVQAISNRELFSALGGMHKS